MITKVCIKGQYTWLHKECDLPSSSPAGSSSIPCKFVQNYTHCIILINSIIQPRITYQASLPTLSSSLEIKFWSSESDSYQSSWCFFTSINSSITASASTLPESSFLLRASYKLNATYCLVTVIEIGRDNVRQWHLFQAGRQHPCRFCWSTRESAAKSVVSEHKSAQKYSKSINTCGR